MLGIRIAATGRYIPETVVSNDDMAKLVETSDEWISTRTGIRTRYMAKGEPTSYMAVEAARDALSRFSGEAEDIGMILCTTITPDYHTPSMACIVQAAIGAKNAFCMDLNAACSGFIYALDIAQKYLASGMVKNVLVVSAETLSHLANFEDRTTCVLFGDGAGACIISGGEGRYASFLGADGNGAGFLYATSFYPRTPFEEEGALEGYQAFPHVSDGFLHMDGKEVYKFSTAAMPRCIRKAVERLGVGVEDIDLIIPHQANVRIVQTAMKNLGLPLEKAYMNIDKFGNTSSASIPIALEEVVRAERLKKGDLVALVGFGAGLTYGATIFDWC